jgi:hypothetical protein
VDLGNVADVSDVPPLSIFRVEVSVQDRVFVDSFTDVSEIHVASIFKVEVSRESECSAPCGCWERYRSFGIHFVAILEGEVYGMSENELNMYSETSATLPTYRA